MSAADPPSGPHALLVEDDFLIWLSLAESLTDHGIRVTEAGTATEALAALAANPGIAVLLTDIQLSDGPHGLELARAGRESRPDLPVIFMTGRPDPVAEARASAIDVFITKPYLPSNVAAVVRRLVGG